MEHRVHLPRASCESIFVDIFHRGSRHKPTLGFLGVLVTLFYAALSQLPQRYLDILLRPPSLRIINFEMFDLANRLHLM